MILRAAAVVCALAPAVLAGGFVPGSLYYSTEAMDGHPTPGGVGPALMRVDIASAFAVSVFAYLPATSSLGGRAAYDPVRDRIVVTSRVFTSGDIVMVAPDATVTTLPTTHRGAMPAPRGDGSIYFLRQIGGVGGGTYQLYVLDLTDTFSPVLNAAGTGTFEFDGLSGPNAFISALWYDPGTNSLIAADRDPLPIPSGGDKFVILHKVPLNAAGTQVSGAITSINYNASIPDTVGDQERVSGFSQGPNGTICFVIDDNANQATRRVSLLDPVTMTVTGYAVSDNNAVFNAGETSGIYLPAQGHAVVLDTLANALRRYEENSVGIGPVLTSGPTVSIAGTSEQAGFVLVPDAPCPGDSDADGDVDFDDLNAVLASFGSAPPTNPGADLDHDGDVDFDDLNAVLSAFGVAC